MTHDANLQRAREFADSFEELPGFVEQLAMLLDEAQTRGRTEEREACARILEAKSAIMDEEGPSTYALRACRGRILARGKR